MFAKTLQVSEPKLSYRLLPLKQRCQNNNFEEWFYGLLSNLQRFPSAAVDAYNIIWMQLQNQVQSQSSIILSPRISGTVHSSNFQSAPIAFSLRVVLNFDITLRDWTIGSRDMIFFNGHSEICLILNIKVQNSGPIILQVS